MSARQHGRLLLQFIAVWLAFWLVGWPAYYQQYSSVFMAVLSILLSVVISLFAVWALLRVSMQERMRLAFWLSLYFTLPFVTLDALYCGWYLGHGFAYLTRYWYLTIFYITPWLTFMPTAVLLRRAEGIAAIRHPVE